jgi:hypothetical protein
MDTDIGDCPSASSGEDERIQRLRWYAIRTAMSPVAQGVVSDTPFYAPRRGGSVTSRAAN